MDFVAKATHFQPERGSGACTVTVLFKSTVQPQATIRETVWQRILRRQVGNCCEQAITTF